MTDTKRIYILLTVLLLLITAVSCGKAGKAASSEPSDAAAGQTVSQPDTDALDPENTEFDLGSGAVVKAGEIAPKAGKANGIDVSKWQGKINWSAVKADGIDFAMIRIGFRGENGEIYSDPYAAYNLQQANKAGLLLGVYFFSTARDEREAQEEADFCLRAVSGYPISYPIVYDCEGYRNPESRMFGLSAAQRTANALAFLKSVRDNGYEGMLYAAKGELENAAEWDTPAIASAYRIWVASYTAVPYPEKQNPDYSGKYDMWQYTNLGRVSGVKGNTDMIVSYFTPDKAAPKGDQPVKTADAPNEEDALYTPVNEQVTAKELTNLRETASTKGTLVGSIKNGDFITRTGVGSNGWSRLLYQGKTVYAVTSYLTTDASYQPPVSTVSEPQIYTDVNEQVTAKDTVNLRSGPSTGDAIVASLSSGQFVTRTGVGTNGWSRLLYNGQTVYAVTSYLSTTVVSKPPETDGQFTEVNEQVTAKEETNLRSKPVGGDGSEIVYLLKKGEYVTRTGVSTSGWSRVIWNGQTLYAVSSYLTE